MSQNFYIASSLAGIMASAAAAALLIYRLSGSEFMFWNFLILGGVSAVVLLAGTWAEWRR